MVAEEIQGGFNLAPIREQYAMPPRLGCNEASQLAKYRREFDIIAMEHGKITEREGLLVRLKQQIEEAKRAKKQLEQVECAIGCAHLRRSIDEVTMRLEQFPRELSLLRIEDEESLEELLHKQPKLPFEKFDIESARKNLREASILYDEIQRIDGRIEGRKEERDSLEICLHEHAHILGVAPKQLLDELSYLPHSASDGEKEQIIEGARLLLEWLNGERNAIEFLFHLLLIGFCFLLTIVAFVQKESLLIVLSTFSLMASIATFLRSAFQRKKIIRSYELLNLPCPKCWEKKEIDGLLTLLEERFLAGLDLQLRYDEIKKAREIVIALKRIEIPLEEMLKEREKKLGEFIELLPRSLREKPLKAALEEFSNLIGIQDSVVKLEQLQKRINCFSCDPLEEFRHKKGLLRDYGATCEEKTRLEGRFEQALLQLTDRALLFDSLESLQEKQCSLQSLALSMESLREQETSIVQEINHAFSSKRYQEASHKIQNSALALKQKEKEWKANLFGLAFLKEIEERFEREQKPEVLKRAGSYFEKFSLGSYAIDTVKRQGGAHRFCLFDRKRERPVFIEELSRGLELQLLLAVRLGYLEVHEKEQLRLPLFFDEVLCHVDDDRFSWIAKALIEVAQERQIFLFTCQRSTMYAWKKVAKENPGACIKFIDLEELQGQEKKNRSGIQMPAKQPVARRPFPEEPLAAYAKDLGLSGLNVLHKLVEQPSWLVFQSAEELFQALSMKIKTVGHLLTILALHPKTFSDGEMIQSKSALLEKFLGLSRVGNPPSIERHDLEIAINKGIFSSHFLDAVDLCTDRVGRKGEALLNALKNKEVKRFQEKSIRALEEHLRDEGFIDLRRPFSEEEIRTELEAVAVQFTPEIASYIDYLVSLFVANKSCVMSSIEPCK